MYLHLHSCANDRTFLLEKDETSRCHLPVGGGQQPRLLEHFICDHMLPLLKYNRDHMHIEQNSLNPAPKVIYKSQLTRSDFLSFLPRPRPQELHDTAYN